MPGVPGPGSPDYSSRRAPRGGAVGRCGAASGLASAVCLLPPAPVRECQPGGGHPAAAPPAAGEGPTDRPGQGPTDTAAEGGAPRAQRPRPP